MAKKDTILDNPIMFYIYGGDGQLNTRTTKIISPHTKIKNGADTRFQNVITDQKFVVFEGGIYKCESEEEAEWLRLYNNRGGYIEVDGNKIFIKGNMVNQVKEEAPKKKVETTVEYEKVEIQKIPLLVAETMLPDQLKTLCEQWGVPFDKKTTVKTEDYIKLLTESERLTIK